MDGVSIGVKKQSLHSPSFFSGAVSHLWQVQEMSSSSLCIIALPQLLTGAEWDGVWIMMKNTE